MIIAGADLGYASDSDIDPLGGVHRGAGHSQGHRVQRHPATTNQIYSDTLYFKDTLFTVFCSDEWLNIRVTILQLQMKKSIAVLYSEFSE